MTNDDGDDDEGSSTGAVIAIIIVVCLGIVVAALLWVFREKLCKKDNVKKYNQTTIDPDESARDPSVDRPLKATFEDPEKKSDDIEIGSDDSRQKEKDM